MGKFFVEKRFQYILIILMGLLVYSKTLFFGFTYLDDARLILDDQVFLSKASNILSVFRQDVLGGPFSSGIYYRPLLTLSLMLDAHLGGESAFIYHLTNMALHILTSCLVLLLLTKLGYEKGKSLFFSLLFTVHPVLTQAVAWIPGRNDILLTLFTLISFISLMDFIDKGGAVGYIWHILFFVLAIFTKETALFFPPVCLAYLVFIKKIRMGSFRIKVPALGWAAVIFLWFVVRHLCLPNQMKITLSYIFRNIAINSPAAVQLIGKIIFPVDLSVLPIMRDTTFIYGIAAVILITAALAVSKRARYHYLIFGLSWFALFLLPAFIRPNATIAADFLEHRLYLPIIGFIIILMETDLVKDFKIRSAKGAFIIYAILLIFR